MCEETNLIEENKLLNKKELFCAVIGGLFVLILYTLIVIFFCSIYYKQINTKIKSEHTVNTIPNTHDITWYIQKNNEIIKLTNDAKLLYHNNIINTTDNIAALTIEGETKYVINTDRIKPDPKMKALLNKRLLLINEYNNSIANESFEFRSGDEFRLNGIPIRIDYILDFNSGGEPK